MWVHAAYSMTDVAFFVSQTTADSGMIQQQGLYLEDSKSYFNLNSFTMCVCVCVRCFTWFSYRVC